MNPRLTPAEQKSYLISFLALLVHRSGGEMMIENLSEVADSSILLSMELDADNDRVTLRTEQEKSKKPLLH